MKSKTFKDFTPVELAELVGKRVMITDSDGAETVFVAGHVGSIGRTEESAFIVFTSKPESVVLELSTRVTELDNPTKVVHNK